MDIRRFFSPPKGSTTSTSKTTIKPNPKAKPVVEKVPSEKATVKSSVGKKPDKKQSKEKTKDIVVLDSESDPEDKPIKIIKKTAEQTKEANKATASQKKDGRKPKTSQREKSSERKKNSDEPNPGGSPSEKENKTKQRKNQKEAEKEPIKETKKKSPKSVKRKSVPRTESDEDEEEFEVRRKRSSKPSKARKGAVIFDSDSDEDPIPPTQHQEKKRSRKSKTITFVSDSDEDAQPSISAAFKKVVPKTAAQAAKVKSPEVKATVSAADFFGSTSVRRADKKTPVKRKAERSPITEDEDLEIHDDEDFEKTLQNLDQVDHKAKKVKRQPEDAVPETTGRRLAGKISAMKKASETFVPDTPEKSPKKASPVKKETPNQKNRMVVEETPQRLVKSPGKSPSISPGGKETPGTAEKSNTPRQGAGGYRAYLNRAPPQALGSKEVPKGEPNCLEGLVFVISGVLESLERDDAKSLIERLGGKVTGSLSKKTSYLVVGRDAGASKTAKAADLGTKQLDEDGLFELIKKMPGKRSKYEIEAEASVSKERQQTPKRNRNSKTQQASPAGHAKQSTPVAVKQRSSQASPATSPRVDTSDRAGLMWVDKYKPASLKQVIGQQGPKSNANKLLHWLTQWHRWQAEGRKPAFGNRFSDDGTGYKAALLSGPPGVGKTTTATLVCQELGFSYVELNASDTRSKKSLDTLVTELLSNHTVVDFMGGSKGIAGTEGKKHCLIMDEVDGMAGNEDRGGMQELISLIKKSRIPIICMCNDRNSQKVRSLANSCFDLRFQRPRLEQIKAAMMSLVFKEGVKIPPPALNEVIAAANQDIRQVIHNLSMWSVSSKTLSYDQIKQDAAKATKDIKMGPFDVCRKVFVGGEETARMTINDKSDLFFHDYSFAPLFVHENYIHASPFAARGNKIKHLQCLSEAIDSIADGDLVDRSIRREQKWNLLPTQAMFASVIPGEAMRGGFSTMVQFPQWLGKNSTTNKTDRILQDLRMHMSLRISGDKRALNMDYVPHLRRKLTAPLRLHQQDGVNDVLGVLHSYDLLKDDYDSILEISQWSHLAEPLATVDSKTKAALTRAYNKEGHLTPYAAVAAAKKGRGRGGAEDLMMGGDEDGTQAASDQESDDDVKADGMIKSKSNKGRGRGRGQTKEPANSKGKGQGKTTTRGRGRGRGKKT